jgi:NosR/NirI family nitrous oxide reductase transcriptional regulator
LLLIELYAALAEPQRIGRNLLGQATYLSTMARLEPGDAAILVAANGLYSFKGTAFVRTGEFDRIRIVQDGREFRLRSEQHRRIDALLAEGAPHLREIGLFIVPRASGFDHLRPWRVQVTIARSVDAGAPLTIDLPYQLPSTYLVNVSAGGATAGTVESSRPLVTPERQVAVPAGAAAAGRPAESSEPRIAPERQVAMPAGAATAGWSAESSEPRIAPELQIPKAVAEAVSMGLVALSALIAGFVALLFAIQRRPT